MNKDYTLIPNIVLNDERLTLECKLVILYLLMNKETDKKMITMLELKKKLGCGRVKIKRFLKILSHTGYVVKKLARDEQGRLRGFEFILNPDFDYLYQ